MGDNSTTLSGGTHGIALIPSKGMGYVGNGDQVTAFSLSTATLGTSIATDVGADATLYDPASDRVFVMNGKGQSITAVNRATKAVLATLPAGGKPEFAAVDGRGHLFVNGEDARELLRIDTKRLTITARWPLAECEAPHGLAMDAKTNRLFVGCVNHHMLVVNAHSGAIVATLPIGQGSDAIAFDSRRKIVYSSNGEGTLSRFMEIDANHYKALATLPTAAGARTMAVDSSTGRVFLVTADEDPNQPPNPRRHFLAGTTKMLIFAP
jgi:DNA-binding beta-propeller fold protein YncE